jgi:glycosyltransferase involved in cell wall biosynthesis
VSGGSRRAANIIAALEGSFDVTVAAADGVDAPIPGWREASSRFIARRRSRLDVTKDAAEGLVKGQHGLLVRSVRAGMPAVIEAWLRQARPDLVILGRPLLTPYIRAAHAVGARVVVDADESLQKVAWSVARSGSAPLHNRLRFAIEAFAVGRMERSSYPQADQLWVSSDEERRWLATFVDPRRVVVIPNAVVVPSEVPTAPEVQAVCFLGWYRYPPNEAAALELMSSIMPAIRSAGGPSRLILIGSEPTAAMLRAAARLEDVTITGQVVDVVSELRGAGVLVVPVRSGGGTRVKILEAMAAGVPVVSTTLGVEGLGLSTGVHVLIADRPVEFAAQVVALASDQDARSRLVRASFEAVTSRHSIASIRSAVATALAGIGMAQQPRRP